MGAMKSPPIRVLIADGDPLVCRALTHLLTRSPSVDVIATSSDRDEVLELAGRLNPAVALVDAHTVRMDGLDVTRTISRLHPTTRVVALGVYPTMRDQAIIAGACRFLLKDCSGVALVEAIRLAASGECGANRPT
jgi:DNA-binding NarL/FixJ family response regulator